MVLDNSDPKDWDALSDKSDPQDWEAVLGWLNKDIRYINVIFNDTARERLRKIRIPERPSPGNTVPDQIDNVLEDIGYVLNDEGRYVRQKQKKKWWTRG